MPRRSADAVAESRELAVEAAVQSASVEGLEGLTIGRLADRLQVSKSGLFGLFGSKLDLQLQTLARGLGTFWELVWRPATEVPEGRDRLLVLCELWMAFHERETFAGGCFMTTATVEFDARPGPLREAVRRARASWLATLANEVAVAVGAGELPPETDPEDVAFALNAFAAAGSTGYTLSGEAGELRRAERLMKGVLGPPRRPSQSA